VAQPDIWIGTIEISWSDEKTPNVFKAAFTVVTTWANSPEEFREKCVRMLESYGWKLLGVEERAHRFRCAFLSPDHSPQIFRMSFQF
jgi:hypothetical protein